MLSIRKLFVGVLPLRHCVLYSNNSNQKPRVTSRKKKLGPPKFDKFRQEVNFGSNPGVEGQLNALNLTEQESRDPDILEDMEQQFWNVDKIADTVDREKHINQELQSIYQITRKQFKQEKSPNMLLWDEKQQIKTLHDEDPEKWTCMRLAFSFPATPSIIQKLLKAKWNYTTQEQIEKHDARVRRNWESLLKDELEVPNEDLKKHLLSFSQRSKILSSSRKDISTQTVTPPPSSDRLKNVLKDGGVFGNLYKSYKPFEQTKMSEANTVVEEEVQSSAEAGLKKLYQPPQKDTFIIPKVVQDVRYRTNRPLPLENMKSVVFKDIEKGEKLGDDEMKFIQEKMVEREKHSYSSLKDPIGKVTKEEFHSEEVALDTKSNSNNHLNTSEKITLSLEDIGTNDTDRKAESSVSQTKTVSKFIDISQIKNIEKLEDKEIFASLKTAKIARSKLDDEIVVKAVKEYVSHSSESYPLEISIPKDKWKKGALYRVKDRFYTDDGEFLFRVPGMTRE